MHLCCFPILIPQILLQDQYPHSVWHPPQHDSLSTFRCQLPWTSTLQSNLLTFCSFISAIWLTDPLFSFFPPFFRSKYTVLSQLMATSTSDHTLKHYFKFSPIATLLKQESSKSPSFEHTFLYIPAFLSFPLCISSDPPIPASKTWMTHRTECSQLLVGCTFFPPPSFKELHWPTSYKQSSAKLTQT